MKIKLLKYRYISIMIVNYLVLQVMTIFGNNGKMLATILMNTILEKYNTIKMCHPLPLLTFSFNIIIGRPHK